MIPSVLIAPRSLNPDGGRPSAEDCAVWNTTFRAAAPGQTLAIVWADGTVACTRRRPDGMWESCGRSETRARAAA